MIIATMLRNRTGVTVLMITVGVLSIVVAEGVIEGIMEVTEDNVVAIL